MPLPQTGAPLRPAADRKRGARAVPAAAAGPAAMALQWLVVLALLLSGGAVHAAAGSRLVEVAPGVYLAQGAAGEPDPANLGRVGNAGFIVGDSGVIAIDTGTSYRQGVALLEAIGRVTPKPVRLVLITHARQEFLFGAAAYRERGIPIHMHRKTARLMAARCENCLKNLRRTLGEEEMRGTAIFKPDREFEEGHAVEAIGRPVRVLYHGHSSGPGDIAVLDERTGALFAGGLLDNQRIPDIQDGDPEVWRKALAALQHTGAKTVVPGHGPAVPAPEAIAAVERYLAQLETKVRELLRAGVALSAVADRSELPGFEGWDLYDTVHRRNASIMYLRLEREQIFKEE